MGNPLFCHIPLHYGRKFDLTIGYRPLHVLQFTNNHPGISQYSPRRNVDHGQHPQFECPRSHYRHVQLRRQLRRPTIQQHLPHAREAPIPDQPERQSGHGGVGISRELCVWRVDAMGESEEGQEGRYDEHDCEYYRY